MAPTLVIVFLVLFGAFLATPTFSCKPEPGFIAGNISNARQLITACKIFALEHQGAYPKDLNDLVKTQCIEREQLDRLNQYRTVGNEQPLKWTVILDLKDSDPYDLPIVVSPVPMKRGKCILGLNDSSVRVASEKEVDDAMERLRKFREERDKKTPPAVR